MGNFHTEWVDGSSSFRAADMNAPLTELDRALTYQKGVFVGCDGILSWAAGTLTWSGTIHIFFNSTAGLAIHNTIAAGNIALSDGEFAYVDLSETNNAAITVAKAAFSTGAASNFITYNRLLLGYRNTADDGFYPEELAGIFSQMIAGGSYVEKSTYNAYTVLAADTDDTPAALTVAASTIVGRKSTGGIVAMTMADLRTELGNLDGREQAITCADNVTIDWSAGATARMTFDRDAVALTLSNGVNGKVYRLLVKQSSGGSDTLSYATTIKWRGGAAPVLSTAGNAEDILTFVYINGAWYGDGALAFASV